MGSFLCSPKCRTTLSLGDDKIFLSPSQYWRVEGVGNGEFSVSREDTKKIIHKKYTIQRMSVELIVDYFVFSKYFKFI